MTTRHSLRQFITWQGIDRPLRQGGMLLDFIESLAAELSEGMPIPDTLEVWKLQAANLDARLRRSLGLDRLAPVLSLEPQVVGAIRRDGYVVEQVVFRAAPDLWVAGHLYVPDPLTAPAPAVLYAPGHWMENGKLEPVIQVCCANLAMHGLVVLACDPIGQGERFGSWLDHGHLEPLLVGVSQEGLMVWESMRAVDYLLSRPEVDETRIGMTGASGGGLNTFYTSVVDERIKVSVPVCYVTTFRQMMVAERDQSWEDGVDLCNQLPEVMAYADMGDICGLFAPRPLCIIAAQRDWMFPIEGAQEMYRRARHVYRLLGAEEHTRLVEVDSEHGYDQPAREAAYGWLLHWLKGDGNGDALPEQGYEPLPVPYDAALTYIAPPAREDLDLLRRRSAFPVSNPAFCFPAGEAAAPGAAITHLAHDLAVALPPLGDPPDDPQAWVPQRSQLLAAAHRILGRFPTAEPLVNCRTYNQVLHGGMFAERVVFESEPGIEIPAMFLAPAKWNAYLPCVVYVDEWGKQVGMENGIIEAMLGQQLAVLAIDVRGVGETATSDFEAATNSLMTDRPLFGQRVWDVLRAVDYLWRRIYIGLQIDKGRIACLGRGAGGSLCLYAAAMDERLAATGLWEAPLTYQSLIVEQPGFASSMYLFDVLNHLDLPHLMAAVAPRALLIADPVDGVREPVNSDAVAAYLRWPRAVYDLLETSTGVLGLLAAPNGAASPGKIAAWLARQLCLDGVSGQ
jgi:cephalosporin-C deacetylase-like acetyl esterase